MKPLTVALVTLAVAGVGVGAGVWWYRRSAVQRLPDREAALLSADNAAAQKRSVEAATKAAQDAAGKAGDVGAQIVKTISDVKSFVDGLGQTFAPFGDLFR